MSESSSWLAILNYWCLALWFALPVVILPVLFFFNAPYGKFVNKNFGHLMSGKLGWAIQEMASPIVFCLTFLGVSQRKHVNFLQLLLVFMWNIHYFNRSVIYTIRMPAMKPTAVAVVLSAIGFNLINGFINGYAVATAVKTPEVTLSMLTTAVGVLIFAIGMFGNITSDSILMSLRQGRKVEHHEKYYIPNGGLYEFISCPNYFFEIVEWIGYAVASGFTPAACSFVLLTIANLLPRALSTHHWYLENFKEKYPKTRQAIIPYIL